MKGKLYFNEVVENTLRKAAADPVYYPVRIEYEDGCEANALFTIEQIEVAIARAEKNPEDIPDKSLWEVLLG